jgi:hypothetical protein
MAGDEEKPIRIVDRRMFTPDGELRPDYQPEEAARAAAGPPEAPAAAPPDHPAEAPEPVPPPAPSATEEAPGLDEEPEATQEPGSDFASLVRSLATTAYSALGLLPDPSGIQRRDAVIARQMIDWLAMLELKTRGNVSFEESDFLARVLYELRLAYVEMTRPTPG